MPTWMYGVYLSHIMAMPEKVGLLMSPYHGHATEIIGHGQLIFWANFVAHSLDFRCPRASMDFSHPFSRALY